MARISAANSPSRIASSGRGYTANLTSGRGGVGRTYSDADWVRSIRYGVRPDGRGIIFMPSDYFNRISDADLGAMIAYLKSLPPVDNERTAVEINFAARLMIDLGMFGDVVRAARIDFRAPRPPPPTDPGAYLVDARRLHLLPRTAFDGRPRTRAGRARRA